MRVDFRHCQVLDPVGSAVAFPKSIEFWKDRRILYEYTVVLAINTAIMHGQRKYSRSSTIVPLLHVTTLHGRTANSLLSHGSRILWTPAGVHTTYVAQPMGWLAVVSGRP